ncbi:phosphoenolpyruvate carboxykinase (ATP) [Halorussus salilacus]|uniref:phosphoenolpyruvate carboxykinase (ATP) n=1 Tax=Halorussus salilacus TaxID=2953750 RepID=UPI00209FDE19|nr:phosphoenolpyruvate carboxykinase (ATP) [Halorussus salilacus]USZ68383.1 phosphoenolpyruvate carboxykinase (ATP) [Halorussus salilacus]
MSESGTRTLPTALPDPADADNVAYDPSLDRLREFSSNLETTTEFGSPSYVSDERSRNADKTKNAVDDDFDASDYARIEDAVEHASEAEMVCVDRRMGRHPDHSYVCRLYVSKEYARIALAWAKLFEPVSGDADPDFVTVQVPEYDETAIRILPEEGVTAVLGSDYTGEAKKSFLRLFMYYAKKQGGLGLHAGSKRVTLQHDDDGDLDEVGQLFLGLSATGKSTLTAHGLWLDDPEEATMLQDDVCALLPDGTVAGSEGNGLYVKTIGLDADEQPAMYDAVTDESAVLENVDVADDGTVDFDSDRHTSNGRAVISRECLSSAGEDIDLDSVDQVFFITRNPTMPPVAKLSPEEAAAAFMLGESIQTSAGDPSKAGESIRVVGTNPFILGSKGEEGNRFRDLVADLDVDCFVINTGHLGERSTDVGVAESVTILREIARGTVVWRNDETLGLTIPAEVPGMDIEEFYVPDHVEDFEREQERMRTERRAHLSTFEDLDDEIEDAVY